MLPRHCSDEQLLAHLDGELSRRRQRKVRTHLARCWECRGRLAELEERVRWLTKAFEKQTFPGEDRLANARSRFERNAHRYERSLVPGPRLYVLPGFAGGAARAVAFCIILLVVTIAFLPWRFANGPTPGDLLTAAVAGEQNIYKSAPILHQDFRIEVAQVKPRQERRGSRLELWAESGGPRFAAKWSDDRGALRYAAWRPERDREQVYSPGLAEHSGTPLAVSFVSIADHGLEPEQLEQTFLRWLRSREWAPISITGNFQAFCSADGVVMGVERRGTSFRFWARRTNSGLAMEMVMEIDSVTYRPRIQTIRFDDGERSAEVRLSATRIEPVAAERVRPSVFEPRRILAPIAPLAKLEQPSPRVEPVLPTKDEQNLDEVEIEVLYSLHRVRACLGEPIEVERVPGGAVRVSGLVETTTRRAQLVAALGELHNPAAVRVEIGTTEEFLQQPSGAGVVIAPNAPATQVRPLRLPIQDELERHFEPRGETRARVVRLANDAVDISKAMLVEAWALRRLGERYDGERFERLEPRSRWLLEVMLRDHLEAFRAGSRRGQEELGPVLASISGNERRGGVLPAGAAQPANLLQGVMALFQRAEEVDTLTSGLFAGAGLPASAADAVASLLAAFEAMEDDSQRVAEQVNGRFSGHPDLRSKETRPEIQRMP
jgi:hypothetical protein